MNTGLVRRLAFAILVASILSIAFDAFEVGLPAPAQMAQFAVRSVLSVAAYGLLVPGLYFISLGTGIMGIARWLAFPALFVVLGAGYAYFSLSGFERYEVASGFLVSGGKLTPAGWLYWEQGAAGKAAIGLIADIVLFGWPSTWLPEDG